MARNWQQKKVTPLRIYLQISSEQIDNDWPGQYQLAKDLCEELNISGLLDTEVSKSQFKQDVKKVCQLKNDQDLINQINSYKKMSVIRDDISKGNLYFYTETLQNARLLFRFRVELFEAKRNFKNKYKSEGYNCDSCESESNIHVLFCPAYSVLRENKSLQSDSDLCEYLKQVLEIRSNLRLNR